MNYRLASAKMQGIVYRFTNSQRHWTAYSADRIEVMARWSQEVADDAMYSDFDPDKEELMFHPPMSKSHMYDALAYGIGIEDYRKKGIRARFHQFLYWLIKITTKKYKFDPPRSFIGQGVIDDVKAQMKELPRK